MTGIPAAPYLIMGLVALALVVMGWRRGTWTRARNRRQLYALRGLF